jgi:hypothetical protein
MAQLSLRPPCFTLSSHPIPAEWIVIVLLAVLWYSVP